MDTEMNTIPKDYSPYLTLDKYPQFSEYLNTSKISETLLCKLLIFILYFRQKKGYNVDQTEAFYKHIEYVDNLIFETITEDEFKELLQCCICLAIAEIMKQSYMEQEDQMKIVKRLVEYNNP